MPLVIVYKQDNGIPAIVVPTQEALEALTIAQVAEKDVPFGKPYAIVDASSLPEDAPQNRWLLDDVDLSEGRLTITISPPATTVADYEDAIQAHVDAAARSKLFRDGVTLASYTTSTNPQWAAEAQAFVAWRDAVWAYAYQELARVTGGERAQPSVEEILAELPVINWP